MPKRVNAWHTPDSIPEGTVCRPLSIPASEEWLAIVSGALAELTLPYRWEQVGSVTPAEASERMTQMLAEYYDTTCGVPERQPYWDEDDGADAPGDDEATGFPWYEELSDWVVTAFLATSFTPAAAIEFVTTARKLRLWFRTRDYGAIVRVLLDGLEIGTQDTYSLEPGMVEFAYDIPVAEGFSAQVDPTWTLRLEHTGTENEDAVATADGFGIEVIRKHIEWGVEGESSPYNTRYNADDDTVEVSFDDGVTWHEAPGLDPRITNNLPPVDTADPRCDAAARMVAHFQSILETIIVGANSAVIAVAGRIISLFMPQFGLLITFVSTIVSGLLALGASELAEAFLGDEWDTFKCILFCALGADGVMSEEGLSQARTEIDAQIGGSAATILQLMLTMTGAGGLNAAASQKTETGECAACECDTEWCKQWIFDDPSQAAEWVLDRSFWLTQGEYISGQYWKTANSASIDNGNVRFNGVIIRMVLPSNTVLTEVGFGFNNQAGNFQPAPSNSINIDGTAVKSQTSGNYPLLTPLKWEGEVAAFTYVQLTLVAAYDLSAPYTLGGSGAIYSAYMKGTGDNPWGEDNC